MVFGAAVEFQVGVPSPRCKGRVRSGLMCNSSPQETQSHEMAAMNGNSGLVKSGRTALGSQRASSKTERLWSKTGSRKPSSQLRENVISDNIAAQNMAGFRVLRAWHAFCNCGGVRRSQLQ
jgi:hypothetical protein